VICQDDRRKLDLEFPVYDALVRVVPGEGGGQPI